MEKDKLIHGILWSVLYLIVYGILTVVGNFLFPEEFLIGCGLTGGIYILINSFFIRYKREQLFVNGLISAFAVLCLGILIGKTTKAFLGRSFLFCVLRCNIQFYII